jgi:anti-sigma regulatory factor (Ser/Thr protein kinase)
MAREVRTDVIITAVTKGFPEAQQQATKVTQEAVKGVKEHIKGFADAEKSVTKFAKALDKMDFASAQSAIGKYKGELKDIAKQHLVIERAMDEMEDKSSEAYKNLATDAKKLNGEYSKISRTIKNLERAFKDQGKAAKEAAQPVTPQQMAQGGLLQGFGQGIAPGTFQFIQRGPGMRRQMLGAAGGRALRGMGGGVGGMAFGGAQGMAQALSSIPIIGGAMAAPLMQGMQQAQQALQFQQLQMGMLPFLGGGGLSRAASVRAGRMFQAQEPGIQARAARMQARLPAEMQPTGAGFGMAQLPGGGFEFQRIEQERPEIVQQYVQGERQRVRRAMQRRAVQIERRRMLGDIRGAGVDLLAGGAPEAMQQAGMISQIGGGTGAEMRQQGLMRAGFAARTMFGVGPEVSGAFLQAGRRGGLVGGRGRAGEALTEALGSAMKMGLEGSEVNDYMRLVAEGITSWKQTGIPINERSLAGMGRQVSGMGLGGVRGMAIAGGVQRAAQGLSMRGPQSAQELIMLRAMGGFRGGGLEQLEQAQLAMEQGQFQEGGMQDMFKTFMGAGGGGAGGRFVFRQAMRQMGVNIGVREAQLLEKQVMSPGKLTNEEITDISKVNEKMKQVAEGAPQTVADLTRQASEAIRTMAPDLKEQARLTNRQLDNGKEMIKTMQALDKSALNVSEKIVKDIGPKMESLTAAIEDFTKLVKEKGFAGAIGSTIAKGTKELVAEGS